MKMKKLLLGLLLTSLTCVSSTQLFAATSASDNLKLKVINSAKDALDALPDVRDLEKTFKEKCFEVIKKYFGIARDKMPKDAEFHACILPDNPNIVRLIYCDQTKEAVYAVNFNISTQQVCSVQVPDSEKGWQILQDVKHGKMKAPVSAESDKQKETNAIAFIKAHQLAGITNPQLVKIMGDTHNRFYFQDTKDPSKKALLYLDPSTYKVFIFNTVPAANELK